MIFTENQLMLSQIINWHATYWVENENFRYIQVHYLDDIGLMFLSIFVSILKL